MIKKIYLGVFSLFWGGLWIVVLIDNFLTGKQHPAIFYSPVMFMGLLILLEIESIREKLTDKESGK
jgi:hypothetical protein